MDSNHLTNQIKHHELATDNTLHVVGVISNPARWNSRYRLFRKWKKEMLATPGIKLYVVEGVYGDHLPECAPEPGEDYAYMCVRLGRGELWLKENMINIAVANLLPRDWKYLCWSDCDVHFRDHYWPVAALRALQVYNVLQPWSHGVSLDYSGGVKGVDSSFGYLQTTKQKMSWGRHNEKDGYSYAHCGYVWCCTRYWWENVGKLIDFCLIGSADHHMSWAMIGRADDTVHGSMSLGYLNAVRRWQTNAMRACSGRVGYIPGRIEHHFHGPTKGRDYGGRWSILVEAQYNPDTDIAYDAQGVIYFIGPKKTMLETKLLAYNRGRVEDSIEDY